MNRKNRWNWWSTVGAEARSGGLLGAIVIGVAAGAAATFLKTQTEDRLQPVAERLWPPREGEKELPGADPADHPQNMPPAEMADRAAGVLGRDLDDDQRAQASQPIHWLTGVGFGVGYSVVSRRYPGVAVGLGVPAGLGLYAATHASTLPAAGLQPFPWRMPAAAVAWEATSHAVYGATLAMAVRLLRRI